ncbi:hypothetical protein [Haloarchaeobius sp. HME9146]|uniref:hypothetical protein n=1 Tax=Haloarchaeobius sp. HME9146 TaxID=2978732 RepID=UPI0021C0ABFE|nr:hypothetical protein [Haloarchaeobius sp. HME9146]MCT9097295.1 hypothetical protein [Haloarchaeobius sp. HME9146]
MVGLYAELFFLLCLVGILVMLWQKLARLNQGERPDPDVEYTDSGGMDPGSMDADGDGRVTLTERMRRN